MSTRIGPQEVSFGFPMKEALQLLRERIPEAPEVFLVLGSGLGGLVEAVQEAISVPFADVPGLPGSGVAGHTGRLVAGMVGGRRVLVQEGRYHFYEGYPSEVVAAPVRLAARLGAATVLLTNAAGGVAPDLGPGSILLLDDHIDLMGRSPLRGPVLDREERFPDMSAPYDRGLQELALETALANGIPLRRGTYAGVLGPSYETPAEVRALRAAGADAVGMSTIPEATVARALGMRVLAFSLVTNPAAGLGAGPLSHEEVLETGRVAGRRLKDLVEAIILRLPRDAGPTDRTARGVPGPEDTWSPRSG